MVLEGQSTPAEEIHYRIERLKSALAALDIDAALIFQKADLFYFSGTIQQGQLYVPAAGEPLLMVRKSAERARAESPIDKQVFLGSPRQMPHVISDCGLPEPRRLGVELDVIPAILHLGLKEIFSGSEQVDLSEAIRSIRAVKSAHEIDRIREAARCADQVAGFVAGELKEGLTEVELAGNVEAEARRLGHQGSVRMRRWNHELFYGRLMAGPGAAVPSDLSSPTAGASPGPAAVQGPSLRPIRRREPVLVDYVFAKDGYLAGHARIFAIGGLEEDLLRAHQAALDIQRGLIRELRPGTPSGRIYDLALAEATERGCADFFMGAESEGTRFVGHGIGLELDEYPFLAQGQQMPLESGMIIALGPKLIFPGRGVVGIENTHLITDQGAEQLTRFPEDITIV